MSLSLFRCFFYQCLLVIAFILTPGVNAAEKEVQEQIPLKELRAFTEAYFHIKSSYVKPVDDVTLLRAAIRGMVNSLDDHSKYLPPEEFERFNTDNEGEYAGIGLQFNDHKFGLEVAAVINNSPAFKAGIKVGMIVTHIDGNEVKYLPAEQARNLFKGVPGSEVVLVVAAAEFARPKNIALQRELILLESVSRQMLPDHIGYISISQFTLNTVSEFKQAINELSTNNQLSKLIIDLRDNPGGILEVAVELSDLFVSHGKLLISTGRTEDSNETFYAHSLTPLENLQVVVIMNAGSASASEIMAIALQEHKKALILGEASYGKGTIQTVFDLNENSGMKITTAEYFSPFGAKIQDVGVKPDIAFSEKKIKNTYNVSLLDDPQLLQAYNILHLK
ncbi:S41 family peptidase [Aliikangiella sp. IMCC44359]|uniref:S41 family peptidase n=1 Tax=Aliikangiella sp. IMCC44359 TaxID=3459125 RepID=UPI00403AE42E